MYKDYIPAKDADFWTWAKSTYVYISNNLEDWKIPSPSDSIDPLMGAFDIRYQKIISGAPITKGDYVAKREARANLVKAWRNYIQRHVAKNDLVTNADRQNMGLNLYSPPVPIPAPAHHVSGELTFPALGTLRIVNIKPTSDFDDKRSAFSVQIKFGYERPVLPDDLPNDRITKRKSLRLDLREHRGKPVFVCMRYINQKGQTGPWGTMLEGFVS